MTSRKERLKTLGFFALGFLAGGILFGGLIAWRYAIMFRDQYYFQILETTNVAYMIRAGHEEELVKNIESSLRQCVAAADSLWGDSNARLGSFWYVQRYYERFGIEVPAEIRPILKKLPPRPLTSCEIRNLQEGKTEPNKAAP
ncbi:MAG: hypothetical protein NTW93_01365 [Phycisphaerae bacterium]|nr:hypothetical protein [Phycisphaerae bacterium]